MEFNVQQSITAVELYVQEHKQGRRAYLRLVESGDIKTLEAVTNPNIRQRFYAFFKLQGFKKIEGISKILGSKEFQEKVGDNVLAFNKAVAGLNQEVIQKKQRSILGGIFWLTSVKQIHIRVKKEGGSSTTEEKIANTFTEIKNSASIGTYNEPAVYEYINESLTALQEQLWRRELKESRELEEIGDSIVFFKEELANVTLSPVHKEDCEALLHYVEMIYSYRIDKSIYGHGIKNRDNFCYINSTIQALRNVDAFAQHFNMLKTLDDEGLKSQGVSPNLFHKLEELYDTLEQGTVPDSQIRDFRKTLRKQEGWRSERKNSQEDAAEFTLFLLGKLGIKSFSYSQQVDRELKVRIPSFDSPQQNTVLILPISDMMKSLAIKEDNSNKTKRGIGETKKVSIQDLVTSNTIEEEISKEAIQGSEWYREKSDTNPDPLYQYTEEEKAEIDALPDSKSLETTQTIRLIKGAIPELLPVQLKRFEYAMDGRVKKLDYEIEPSETLTIDVVDGDKKVGTATYKLCAVTVHDGFSPNFGHYYNYVPKKIGGSNAWVEFNDSTVSLHKQEEGSRIDRDMRKNGYLFFYTLEKPET